LQAAASEGEDSDSAKQQRFLDFFKDLGDQYWGWQVGFTATPPMAKHGTPLQFPFPWLKGMSWLIDTMSLFAE
jgi:hypothetical protein